MKHLTIIVWILACAAVSARYPHNAFIPVPMTSGSELPCRGSLIGQKYILTAASCFYGTSTDTFDVFLGLTETSKYMIHTISSDVIFHDDDIEEPFKNDIALMIIPRFRIQYYINIIKLPPLSQQNRIDLYADREVIVSRYSESVVSTFTVLSNAVCEAKLNASIYDSNMCIIRSDACILNSDRGGSVFLKEENVLIGVVSHGPENICGYNKPNVVTSITSYLQWIKSNTGISY